MNNRTALKAALVSSIICPEEMVDQFVAVAARAAALVSDEDLAAVEQEIEDMTPLELFAFVEEVFANA